AGEVPRNRARATTLTGVTAVIDTPATCSYPDRIESLRTRYTKYEGSPRSKPKRGGAMAPETVTATPKPNPYFDFSQLQCETDTGIETIPLAQEVSFRSWQQAIPERYWHMEADELSQRIRSARATLG